MNRPKVPPVSWLGLGPHENYPDRRLAADLGRWQLPIEALHTLMSSHRQRAALRYPRTATGDLAVEGRFHFSVSRYSQQQLTEARHQTDLVALGGAPVPRWLPHGGRRRRLLEPERAARVLAVAGALSVALPSELAGPAVARWRDPKAVSHVTI